MEERIMTRKELFVHDVLEGKEEEFDCEEFCVENPSDPESVDYIPGLPIREPHCIKHLRGDCYKSCEECWNQPIDEMAYCTAKAAEVGTIYAVSLQETEHTICDNPSSVHIPGLDPDVPVTTNANGDKQSSTPYGFHLLPTSSVFAAAEVAAYGANKYGEDFHNRNYIKIPVEDHINHCIQHLYGYLAGDTSDDHLGHAIVRAMFAYDVAHRTKER